MWRATLRGLLAHKLRLVLSGLAIVLGVAFVSGTMIFTDTLSRTFTNLFESTSNDVSVTRATTFEAGFECVSTLLKKKPGMACDGLFAASDLLAMGAIRALTEASLRVPDDISVIGYDDTPGAASFVPPLTSVHQYLRDGGVLLAKKMLAMIEGQPVQSEMLPTTLIVRHT